VLLTDGVVALRPVAPDDVDAWLAGEDDEQIRWFEAPGPAPRANVERAIDAWVDGWASGGPVRHLAICDARTAALAGGVEVRPPDADVPTPTDGLVNLSYLVFPAFRGRGFAVRASRLLVAWAAAHLDVREVEIKVLEGNAASLAVAARLGAVRVGTRRSPSGATFVVHRLRPTA